MKHCKWDTRYPDVSKEFKCNKPATVEVFELSGHKEYEWKNDYDQLMLMEWAVQNGYVKLWSCAK